MGICQSRRVQPETPQQALESLRNQITTRYYSNSGRRSVAIHGASPTLGVNVVTEPARVIPEDWIQHPIRRSNVMLVREKTIPAKTERKDAVIVFNPNSDVPDHITLGVPRAHKGGIVNKPTNTMYRLQKGEMVVPKKRVKAVQNAMKKAKLKPIINFV